MHNGKTLTKTLLTLALLLILTPALAGEARAAGGNMGGAGCDGSAANPYEISDDVDLAAFRDLVNGGSASVCAKLTANVALTGDWTPIGRTNALKFAGTFDGQEHSVTGLTVNVTNDGDGYAGLFGYIAAGGKVQNVNVSGSVEIKRPNGAIAGGIAGNNEGLVQSCAFHGAVSAWCTDSNNGCSAGGVVGGSSGTVENCAHDGGAVSAKGEGTPTNAGGVVGYIRNNGTVKNCVHNGGAVSAVQTANNSSAHAGGVVGLNYGDTVNCSSAACAVTASGGEKAYAGGVVGHNMATVTGCTYQYDTSIPGAPEHSVGNTEDDTGKVVVVTPPAVVTPPRAPSPPPEPFRQTFEPLLYFDGGSVAFSRESAGIGDTVTLTVRPDAGHRLEKLTIDRIGGEPLPYEDRGNGVYAFEMPGWRLAFNAVFEPSDGADAAENGREARDLAAVAMALHGVFDALLSWLAGGAK